MSRGATGSDSRRSGWRSFVAGSRNRAPMSSRRKVEVRISRAADRDIENMAHHMRHAWGEDQLLAYEATIYQTLDMRSRNPQAGRSRDDLFPSCRSFPIEQHVIYY